MHEKWIEFLKKNDALDKFIDNMGNNFLVESSVFQILCNTSELIDRAFRWGGTYWHNIDSKWRAYLEAEND